mgnify:CR=1 FL=1
MTRPRRNRPDRVSTAVRLDPDIHARLRAEADRRLVSVNLLISKAVEKALTEWEPQDIEHR